MDSSIIGEDSLDYNKYAPELGVFIIIMIAYSFKYLSHVQGKANNISLYYAHILHHTNNESNFKHRKLHKAFIITILVSPLISFLCWIANAIYKTCRELITIETTLSFALVTLFIFLLLLSRFRLGWNFKTKAKQSFAILALSIACLIAYQIVITFIKGYSYFSVSAIFMLYNLIFIMPLVYIACSLYSISFIQYLTKALKNKKKDSCIH